VGYVLWHTGDEQAGRYCTRLIVTLGSESTPDAATGKATLRSAYGTRVEVERRLEQLRSCLGQDPAKWPFDVVWSEAARAAS
jgi:hypothetical protein